MRVFPTLGYHAVWGVALKKHNFTNIYGENCCERWGERTIMGRLFWRVRYDFSRSATEAVEQMILCVASHPYLHVSDPSHTSLGVLNQLMKELSFLCLSFYVAVQTCG